MVHDQSSHPRSVCNNFPIHHTIFSSLFCPTLSLSYRHFPFVIFIVILFLSLSDNEFSFSSIFLIFTHMVAFNIQFFLMLHLQFLVKLCGFLTVRWNWLTKYLRSLRTAGTLNFWFPPKVPKNSLYGNFPKSTGTVSRYFKFILRSKSQISIFCKSANRFYNFLGHLCVKLAVIFMLFSGK